MKTPLQIVDEASDALLEGMSDFPSDAEIDAYNTKLQVVLTEQGVTLDDYHQFVMDKYAAGEY